MFQTQTVRIKHISVWFTSLRYQTTWSSWRWTAIVNRLEVLELLDWAVKRRKGLKWRSGTLWLCGPGILWWITVLSAGTTSWICVLSARQTKPPPPVRSVQWPGECVITPSTSTVFHDGWRLARCVLWIIETGSSRSTDISGVYIVCGRTIDK